MRFDSYNIQLSDYNLTLKPVFHLANLFARTEKKSNLIGWRQTLTSSPANHIRFLLVRANKFDKWKIGLSVSTQDKLKIA
jgi:hypothetical protein